jgi:hypothetical protein
LAIVEKYLDKIKRNISIFVFISLSCGWFGLLIDRKIRPQPNSETSGMGIWLVLPLVTMLLLRLFAGDDWKDIGFKPNFKKNIKWYIVSIIIFPVMTTVVLLIGKITGWIDWKAGVHTLPDFSPNLPRLNSLHYA